MLDGSRQQFGTRWSYVGWAGAGASFGGSVALWVMGALGAFSTSWLRHADDTVPRVSRCRNSPHHGAGIHLRMGTSACWIAAPPRRAPPRHSAPPQRPAATPRHSAPPQRPATTPRHNAPPQRPATTPRHNAPPRRSATMVCQDVASQERQLTPSTRCGLSSDRSASISHPTPDMIEDSTGWS